jgi:sugar (pentulose or hexulose) kinase
MINLDENGEPLRPAIVWLDQRRTKDLPPITGPWGQLFKVSGLSDTVAYFQAEAEINWIQKHQPEIWERTSKYLFLSGYLTNLLVGQYVDSVGCQVGYIPFDYKKHRWARRFNWKWKAVPVDLDQLPELILPGESLGSITAEASAATGIPKGLPLIAAAADKACEVIGAGCLDPEIACLSYGTTATINTVHDRYIEPIPLVPPYPAAIPGCYNLEIQIYRGFWMVKWFKKEFGIKEQELAQEKGVAAEELLDDLVGRVPPGSQGLILQPYWSPGLRHPGPEARGAIIGFGDVHTRAHLYRAILEGLAYALKEGAERIGKRSGVPIRQIRVAGGGSQSDAALQLTADIFGLPVYRPHLYEASGLGAAICAAFGSGLFSSYSQAVSEMTHLGDQFEPDPGVQEVYENLYNRVYKKMYHRLRPLYKDIRKITHLFE